MGSVLNYIGKKDIDLTKYDIESYNIYCEPFSGSFNTGFNLLESNFKGKVIYNDLDDKLINFWNCLKENPSKLFDRCNTLYEQIMSKNTDIERKNTLKYWNESSSLYKQAASKYIGLLFTTMQGIKFHRRIPAFAYYDFILASELLNRENVIIENSSFELCIEKYDSLSTFFLIDPPYIRRKNLSYYSLDFQQLDFNQLEKSVDNIKGSWLLTYSNAEDLKEKYKKYQIEEITRIMYGIDYTELYIYKK